MTGISDPLDERPSAESGFVLVVAMMMLLVLSILGIIATRSTMIELTISGNDKVHKQTFSLADGGTEFAQQLIYQNAICALTVGGFTANAPKYGSEVALIDDSVLVEDLEFSDNVSSDDLYETVSDSNRSFAYYPDEVIGDNNPHTNFLNTSSTVNNAGEALQMVSGYEGDAASSASGTSKVYTIVSQHKGEVDSQSLVKVEWKIDNNILSSASMFDCDY